MIRRGSRRTSSSRRKREKFDAVIEDIKERHEHGQPILVGTISIETSEMLSRKLQKHGLKHNVLNAKQHEREAEIVAQAGRIGRDHHLDEHGRPRHRHRARRQRRGAGPRQVPGRQGPPRVSRTGCATFEDECRAEREKVLEAGGLHILGTERHESRRIDNQLRGRVGPPGRSGLEPVLPLPRGRSAAHLRGRPGQAQWWDRVGVEEGEAIENRMLSRVIEDAQKKVEARNFDIRKHLLEYDDVMNRQRQAFYARRRQALDAENVHDEVLDMSEGVLVGILDAHWPDKGDPEPEALGEIIRRARPALRRRASRSTSRRSIEIDVAGDRRLGRAILDRLIAFLDDKAAKCNAMAAQYEEIGYPGFQWFERDILLRILDTQWKDHLHTMDGLREGIGLRGYAQQDPKVEFQREGFELFEEIEPRIDEQAVELIFKFVLPEPPRCRRRGRCRGSPGSRPGSAVTASGGARRAAPGAAVDKVGRNEPVSVRQRQEVQEVPRGDLSEWPRATLVEAGCFG